jgi:hypothetical protein
VSRHVSAEQLARRHEGVVSARRAARIDAHVSACARCTDTSSDLSAVSSLLAATQLPAMPDFLAQRLDMAIATESASRVAAGAPAGTGAAAPGAVAVPHPEAAGDGGPVHTPGRPDLPERAGQGPRRFRMPGLSSPLVLRGLAATAAVAVIAGAGFLLARNQVRPQSESTSGGRPTRVIGPSVNQPAAALPGTGRANIRYHLKGKVVTTTALSTSTNFTRHSLARQVRKDLASSAGIGPTPSVPPGQSTTKGTEQFSALSVSRLQGCLSRVDAGRKVLLTEIARYLGKPATLIILRPPKTAGILDVMIVGLSCSASAADVILRATIPAS